MELRKQQLSKKNSAELNVFLNLTKQLNWLGHGVFPQTAFAASQQHQSISRLTVSHMVTANKLLADLNLLVPKAIMLQPPNLVHPCYHSFSDAIQGSTSYD